VRDLDESFPQSVRNASGPVCNHQRTISDRRLERRRSALAQCRVRGTQNA
jgi:hypothetical protein